MQPQAWPQPAADRAGDVLRGSRRGGSRRRGRLGGAELVDGLAEPGEFGGGFGLCLLDLVEAVGGLVELARRRPGIMLQAGFQRDDLGIEPRHRRFERAVLFRCLGRSLRRISGHQPAKASGCQRATQRTCHRRQRHHGSHRPEPALAGRSPGRRRLCIVAAAVTGRHDHHVAGKAWRFRLYGIDLGSLNLGSSALGASALGASTFGASILTASTLGASGFGEVSSLSGARLAASTSAVVAVIGSPGAGASGAAGPAPRVPVSPLVGWDC